MKLEVKTRETLGRKVKSLRNEGIIPAELFGRGFDNIHLKVPEKKFIKLYREAGKSNIVDLEIADKDKSIPVLIYDIQIHPISRKPLAIDFYRIREDETLQTSVPLEYTGESPIEKEEDFIIVKVLNDVDVECLPREIPENITVDLSLLQETTDKIHASDLDIPKGVELKIDPDTVVVSITEKEEEEEEELEPIMPGELGAFAEDMEGEMPLGEEGEADDILGDEGGEEAVPEEGENS